MKRPKIAVVGNINMDAVVRLATFPQPGENRLGQELQLLEGGKGANQARAVARLHGHAILVGRVGNDPFGTALRKSLSREGVDIRAVSLDPRKRTGMAMVLVEKGQNRIVSVLGANEAVTPTLIRKAQKNLARAKLVLVQLGIPAQAVDATILLARNLRIPVLLDPTPMRGTLPTRWKEADILCPNESELATLLRGRTTVSPAKRIKKLFHTSRVAVVALKRGSRGCLVATREGTMHRIPPFRVKAIDPTGAGDAFSAAFGVAYASGASADVAARFASAAGALATTKLGAAPSLPTLRDIRRTFPSAVPTVLR